MNIEEKLKKIIPPADREHREGFSNHQLIDGLTVNEKKIVEQKLIEMLYKTNDILIVETLSYMNSIKAIDAFKYALEINPYPVQKIMISVAIYKLDSDNKMIEVALNELKKVTSKWSLIFAFRPLAEFNSDRINKEIMKFTTHSDFLIAHNAIESLKISTI